MPEGAGHRVADLRFRRGVARVHWHAGQGSAPPLLVWFAEDDPAAGQAAELNLLLYPVVVGTGERLFPAEGPNLPLTLATSTAFGNGVVRLTYVK
jgi:hypothetical protein